MISCVQAAILGILQGVTELFPVSSLGHSILLPALLKWQIDQASPQFVSFVVLTHLATALVLLGFFWQDWVNIVRGLVRSLWQRRIEDDTYARLGWLIVVSTIPAGLLGLLFEKKLTALFAAPQLVAGVLILNGILLYVAEQLRKHAAEEKSDDAALARLSWPAAVGVGFMQCLALIPGFSRTGLTMTGGLWSGLSHGNAARYAFLLATPIILAASVLEVPASIHAWRLDGRAGTLRSGVRGALRIFLGTLPYKIFQEQNASTVCRILRYRRSDFIFLSGVTGYTRIK
jgi:undecaprenyl-diphosphatase